MWTAIVFFTAALFIGIFGAVVLQYKRRHP